MKEGTQIKIGNVEGQTSRTGTKQNKTYTIKAAAGTVNFYTAVDQKGREVTIWDVNGDQTLIGIYTSAGSRRVSYTKNFQII